MKTKEISFTLPIAVAAYDLLFFRPGRRLLLLTPIAATALLIPLGLVTRGQRLADVLAEASRFAAETQEIPRSVYLLTQSRVVVTYLRLLLLPVRQNLDYDFRLSRSLAEPSALFAGAILLALMAFAVFLLRRARRTNRAPGTLVFFGIAWFFITLSVESSIIPIRDVIFEHRVYLPSVGAVIALATALLWTLERLHLSISPAARVAGALLITAGPLGIAAHARNLVWKDDLTLWSDVVAKSPGKPRPHNNLAYAYQAAGRIRDAERECREAIRLDPRMAEAHINLGNAYQATGRLDDAVREYREAIQLDPAMAEPHNNLCYVYQTSGRFEDAVRECREAVRLDPGLADAHDNLGNAFRAIGGRLDDAMREYGEAIRVSPGFADAHYNLANAYQTAGRLDEAIAEFVVSLQLRPHYPQAHNNLGLAYRSKGRLDDAVREYREAIRLDPGMAMAHNNLGAAYQAKGLLQDAKGEYREAIRLDPGMATARDNLNAALQATEQLGGR